MPTYSYRCTECENAFDIQQAFTDDSLTECPECGGQVRKVFTAIGVSFTGSGFYRNDSRAKEKGSDSGTSDSGKSEPGKSDSGKSDSGKSDSGKSDSGKSDSGKSDSGKSDSGTSGSGKSDSGKSDSGTSGSGAGTSGSAAPTPARAPASVG